MKIPKMSNFIKITKTPGFGEFAIYTTLGALAVAAAVVADRTEAFEETWEYTAADQNVIVKQLSADEFKKIQGQVHDMGKPFKEPLVWHDIAAQIKANVGNLKPFDIAEKVIAAVKK